MATRQDTSVRIDVLNNDSDPESAAPWASLSVTGHTQGTNGTVVVAQDAKSVTYTPAAGFLGTDTFTYSITNANGLTATATVRVNVLATDDASVPTVSFTQAMQTADESTGTITVAARLSAPAAAGLRIPLIVTGTATAESDYHLGAREIVFATGPMWPPSALRSWRMRWARPASQSGCDSALPPMHCCQPIPRRPSHTP